jgi:hypothetical protein
VPPMCVMLMFYLLVASPIREKIEHQNTGCSVIEMPYFFFYFSFLSFDRHDVSMQLLHVVAPSVRLQLHYLQGSYK